MLRIVSLVSDVLSPEFTRQVLLTPNIEDAKGEKVFVRKSIVFTIRKSKEIRSDIMTQTAMLPTNVSDFFK